MSDKGDNPKRDWRLPASVPAWCGRFLSEMAERPVVTRACRLAGVSRQQAYRYRKQSKRFAAAWTEAEAEGLESLETAALDTAHDGNPTMLIFLLKTRMRETYGDVTPDELARKVAEILRAEGGAGERSGDAGTESGPSA